MGWVVMTEATNMFERQLEQAYRSLRERIPGATKVELSVEYAIGNPVKCEWTVKAWCGPRLLLKIGPTFDEATEKLTQEIVDAADRIRRRIAPSDQASGLRELVSQQA